MKARIIFIIILCLVVLHTIFIISCSEENEPIKVIVISNKGGFSGYYLKDADSVTPFSSLPSSGDIFIYEKKIEIQENIEVSVTTATTATSVEIKIFRDNKSVKSISQTGDGTASIEASLIYTIGEEENTTTTTTTSK